MIGKGFEAITKDDIDALVTNVVSEGRDIEYKEQLPGGTDDDAREFLADVSSFANAGGGDLIYGIREQRDKDGKPTGIPEAAEGLAGINADGQERRLENMLRDGIDPRIPGVRIKHFDGFCSGPVIILRIPKSWASPHMVKFKNLSRFFSRTSAGKYQLDVREIRSSFLTSENLGDKISAFRSDRVGKIFAGEVPLPHDPSPKIVLHLLPILAFSEPIALDLKVAQSACGNLKPMGSPTQWGPAQFNFNGLLSSGSRSAPKSESYVQIFRSGVIEAVCPIVANGKQLSGCMFEQELTREAPAYIKLQKQLGLGPPLFAAISLVFVKGFLILPTLNPAPFAWSSASLIVQDVLLTPAVLEHFHKSYSVIGV
jgi:hypothetical protein